MCQVNHYEFSEPNLNSRGTMTNQEILANGPEGWTHVAIVEDYAHYCRLSDGVMRDKFVGVKDMWTQFQGFEDVSQFRSREDIERIVYLESVLKGKAA